MDAPSQLEWSRSPKHIMRVSAIADAMESVPPGGRFLEVGAGNGDLTTWLASTRTGWVYDLGDETRSHLRTILDGLDATVVDTLEDAPTDLELLCAFEVLEHIEDDEAALKSWSSHLAPGGHLLLSVPAHQRKFSAADEAVGHQRRYERDQLRSMVERCGLEVVDLVNYGFPVGNVTRQLQLAIARVRPSELAEGDAVERSIRSGIRRDSSLNRVAPLFNEITMRPACVVQRWFYRRDLGDGYVVLARRQ